jgi:hypothetical protein
VVEFAAGEFGFHIEYIAEYQLRLHHPIRMKRLDYYPKSRKATWVGTNQYFMIPDIEIYLEKHFKKSS